MRGLRAGSIRVLGAILSQRTSLLGRAGTVDWSGMSRSAGQVLPNARRLGRSYHIFRQHQMGARMRIGIKASLGQQRDSIRKFCVERGESVTVTRCRLPIFTCANVREAPLLAFDIEQNQ